MGRNAGKKKSGIFKGLDITLMSVLGILFVGTIGVSGVLIWIVATL
jgi:hypothetical protein